MDGSGRAADVVVAGAGPWGLAVAWRLATDGANVVVLDDGRPSAGAAAAGMLAPWGEAEDDDALVHDEFVAAGAAWPAYADALARAADAPVGYVANGSLIVAYRPEHVGQVRRAAAAMARLGRAEPWRSGSALRGLEASLGVAVTGGVAIAGEAQADPGLLLPALRRAAERSGVRVVDSAAARIVRDGDGRPTGVIDTAGTHTAAGVVVVAAGAGATALAPGVPVRPVRGETIELGPRPGIGPPLEWTIRSPDVYLVPRRDGRVIIGATVEESGEAVARADGVHRLLDEALLVAPGLRELAFLAVRVGLRPATPDLAPAIGVDGDGLVWAVGGFRNGILLVSLVGDLVADALAGRAPSPRLDPARFERKAAACS